MDWALLVTLAVGLVGGGGLVGILTARASARKQSAEADKTVVESLGVGYGTFVDRLEAALLRCEAHTVELEKGIRQLREAAFEAREAAIQLKERVDTIEREQPAQQRQAVKEAVGEVVRDLGALDPAQHEEGKQ